MNKIITLVFLLISFAAIGQTSTNRYQILTSNEVYNLIISNSVSPTNVLSTLYYQTDENKNLASFLAELDKGGIRSNFVDGIVLRTNYGASASLLTTINGKEAATINNITFNSFGAVFNGTSSYIKWDAFPDLRTNTLVVVMRTPAVPLVVPPNGVTSLIGLFNSTTSGMFIGGQRYFGPVQRENSTENSPGTTYLTYYTDTVWSLAHSRRLVVACTFSNITSTGWIDGVKCAMAGQPTSAVTNSLNTLYIGGTPQGQYFNGEIAMWFVFNKNLTTTAEFKALERAIIELEPTTSAETVNIFIGDSLVGSPSSTNQAQALMNAHTPTNGFPNKLMDMPAFKGQLWWNDQVSGARSDAIANGYRLTNQLYLHGVGGKIKKVRMFVQMGANDYVGSVSSSEIINAFETLANTANLPGIELWVGTMNQCHTSALTGSLWWTDGNDNTRRVVNTFLRNNPRLYSKLFERDLIFSFNDMNTNNGLSRDGLHLSDAGNLRVAQYLAGIENNSSKLLSNYDFDGQHSIGNFNQNFEGKFITTSNETYNSMVRIGTAGRLNWGGIGFSYNAAQPKVINDITAMNIGGSSNTTILHVPNSDSFTSGGLQFRFGRPAGEIIPFYSGYIMPHGIVYFGDKTPVPIGVGLSNIVYMQGNLIVSNTAYLSELALKTNATPPSDTVNIKSWINITNQSGGIFKMPLYQ